mmetsp:Transcript_10759/g.17332  ORF Transcript_10759/g.17332 Transcript_10759/m.17332 type:complete len:124 (+) Transcript_10759:92-463(+)
MTTIHPQWEGKVVFEKGKSFNVIGSPLVWTRHNRNMINKIPKRMKVEHRTKLIEAISFCHQLKGRNALNKEKVPKRSVVVLKLSPRVIHIAHSQQYHIHIYHLHYKYMYTMVHRQTLKTLGGS